MVRTTERHAFMATVLYPLDHAIIQTGSCHIQLQHIRRRDEPALLLDAAYPQGNNHPRFVQVERIKRTTRCRMDSARETYMQLPTSRGEGLPLVGVFCRASAPAATL